jgi:predicted flap endonuclease-1-like 5' DNA nuclease
MNLEAVDGIGETYAAKLREAGITTTEDLLLRARSRSGRGMLAAASGIAERLILQWVNHCDLMRIDGVGPEYADLLEAAGVDSCLELAGRNAAKLQDALNARNEAAALVQHVPSIEMVQRWISAAGTADRALMH